MELVNPLYADISGGRSTRNAELTVCDYCVTRPEREDRRQLYLVLRQRYLSDSEVMASREFRRPI